MSTAYYYFAASLPMLEFGSKPPVSSRGFLEDAERLLSPDDFALLRKAMYPSLVDKEVSNPALSRWLDFSHNFQNEAAWFRANETNKDPMDHLRGTRVVEPLIVDALAQAVKADNPLEGERIIDQTRWNMLEELLAGHYFDLEYILVYGIKLTILERHQDISSGNGERTFEYLKQQVINEERGEQSTRP